MHVVLIAKPPQRLSMRAGRRRAESRQAWFTSVLLVFSQLHREACKNTQMQQSDGYGN